MAISLLGLTGPRCNANECNDGQTRREHRVGIYEVTLWMDSARRLTLPDVIPATDILPSLVAYTEL